MRFVPRDAVQLVGVRTPEQTLAYLQYFAASSARFQAARLQNVYTLQVSNLGPSNASNALLTDPAVAGLNVTAVSCTGATGSAACPLPANVTVPLLQGSGIVIPTLPSGGTVTFTVTATVTATGL